VFSVKFYTNVSSFKGDILYCGYERGKRIRKKIKFKPVLFLPSKSQNPQWRSLDDKPIQAQKFDSIWDAREFIKLYENVPSFDIYGNTRWVSQFLQREFPDDIRWDRDLINISTVDLECISKEGFPKPEDALYPINAITVKNNNSDTYHVWGVKPYDELQKKVKGNVEYRQFRTELEMLAHFVEWWENPENTPDIVTGWNCRLFDVPYLINRLGRVFGGPEMASRLSPWGKIDVREKTIMKKSMTVYELVGITQLDYLDLFQKFTRLTYGTQETYKLGHIANVVLGETKINYTDEYNSLAELYEADHQKFIDYNIKDVELVDRMEDKLGLITLALTLSYIGGVNYADSLGTTAIWESIIYRDLTPKFIAPNIKQVPVDPDYQIVGAVDKSEDSTGFAGGYVKPVQVGMHNWVCSFDLNSLYPNLIIQYNMSPETTLPASRQTSSVRPDSILAGTPFTPTCDTIVAANGIHFRSDKEGVLPRLIRNLYDQRVILKKAMLEEKKRLESIPKGDKIDRIKCEREISRLENHQLAIKTILNSLYGAAGNLYFRYFDLRVAEAVTLSGQLSIRWAEKHVNEYLAKILGTSADYVIAIDTDSLYVNMEAVVNKFQPKNPIKFLDEFCSKGVEPILSKAYDDLAKTMLCPSNRMVMKREAIADRGIWAAKKRYILNVHNNEGVQYAEPKIKVMGLESVKSSTPAICRDWMKQMFKTIMTKTEADAQAQIAAFREEFNRLQPENIASPRRVNDLRKYADPEKIYRKGTPINSRAALLHNWHIKRSGLEQKYDLIGESDNIKFVFLRVPNLINENVIGFHDTLPNELNLHKSVDYETQFSKTFLEPMSLIFQAIGWNTEKVATLEDFFL
jgi:DNA polymerase elongation subunit (family B)